MARKRILIVISSLKIGGGAEKTASVLGTQLYEKKYDVHFLTFYKHTKNYQFKGKHKCLNESFKESVFSKGIKLFTRARKIAKYCREHKIDTCIGFMEAANFPTILSKTLFRNKSKVVVSQRNNPLEQDKISKKLVKLLYNKSDKVTCLSRGVEHLLNKYFGVKNTITIYNMIDIDKTKDLSNEKLSEKHKKYFIKGNVFITVGRLEKVKGHDFLIEAFRKVVDFNSNSKLLILGEGEIREELEKLIKRFNLEDNVFLLGNQKNVFPFIKKSSFFVFSSNHEGFGNVLNEALILNKPIISTDCNYGPREILEPELKINEGIKYPYFGKYGILVSPLNINSTKSINKLGEVMKTFLENKNLKEQYSKKGIERVKDFSTKKIIKEWEKEI